MGFGKCRKKNMQCYIFRYRCDFTLNFTINRVFQKRKKVWKYANSEDCFFSRKDTFCSCTCKIFVNLGTMARLQQNSAQGLRSGHLVMGKNDKNVESQVTSLRFYRIEYIEKRLSISRPWSICGPRTVFKLNICRT